MSETKRKTEVKVEAVRLDVPFSFLSPDGKVKNTFRPIGAVPLREFRFELGEDWGGKWTIDGMQVQGAMIKPVVIVPESISANVDKFGLKKEFEDLGAVYVKAPIVHVVKEQTRRDDRHAVDLPLKKSLEIFADETRAKHAQEKIEFAIQIANEADVGIAE